MPETREDFCGACLAGGAALLGAGTAGAVNRQTKKTVFWISVSISILSILILIYMLANPSSCQACSSSSAP